MEVASFLVVQGVIVWLALRHAERQNVRVAEMARYVIASRRFSPEALPAALPVGIDLNKFDATVRDEEAEKLMVESDKEPPSAY